MAHVIQFTTDRFDISREPPNPINPIPGHSVLQWFKERLAAAGYAVTDPATEDWGWYIEAETGAGSYLIGASADPEDDAREVDWVVQVHKTRSTKDRLVGQNRMTPDDPLTAFLVELLQSDPKIDYVTVTREL
jgi:hypothetical protein